MGGEEERGREAEKNQRGRQAVGRYHPQGSALPPEGKDTHEWLIAYTPLYSLNQTPVVCK